MAANQNEFGRALKETMDPLFHGFGLALDTLVVQNISLPEELEKVLDTRIGMNVIGDMGRFTQYQTANAIPLAAQNEGGMAGVGAGLGAGLTMGQAMAQAIGQGMTTPASAPAAVASASAGETVATIEKLHGLVEKGILSKEEFEAKKAELLKKLV
jgi:membrane protease subunit (stomatin/prohibitin family)